MQQTYSPQSYTTMSNTNTPTTSPAPETDINIDHLCLDDLLLLLDAIAIKIVACRSNRKQTVKNSIDIYWSPSTAMCNVAIALDGWDDAQLKQLMVKLANQVANTLI